MTPKRNSNYINLLREEIESAANAANVDIVTATEVIDYFFLTLRKYLTDQRVPKIIIKGFGTFHTNIETIRKFFLRTFRSYRFFPTKKKKQLIYKRFIQYWAVRNRKILAESGRSDGIDWFSVDPDLFHVNEMKRMLGEKYKEYFYDNFKSIPFKDDEI